MYEEDHSWSFAVGLFAGALVGAALASLFTPRSGQQNRELVREQGLVLKDRVNDATTSATTRVGGVTSTVTERVSGAASTVAERASTVAATVADRAGSALTTVQETASTAATRVAEVASTTTERVSEAASTAATRASEVAAATTERVSEVASTAASRAGEVASAATEKARDLAGRGTEAGVDVGQPLQAGTAEVVVMVPEATAEMRATTSETAVIGDAPVDISDSVAEGSGRAMDVVENVEVEPVIGAEDTVALSAVSYDADADMIITDTAEVNELNAAGLALESDEQFDASLTDTSSRARTYTTLTDSGTEGGGEVPGASGGTRA